MRVKFNDCVESRAWSIPGSVVDLFCGCGALSYGFRQEGFDIACGYDIDEHSRYPFEENNDAPFVCRDIAELSAQDLQSEFDPDLPRILIGCAPCQPFSAYSRNNQDMKWKLLSDFARLVAGAKPDVVTMENVPRLQTFKGGSVFRQFLKTLDELDYQTRWSVLYCPDFGVPQTRSRLVLVASRLGEPSLPVPTLTVDEYPNVRDAIGNLRPLEAGDCDDQDPLHRCSRMSRKNLKRIRASVPGGTWRDWDESLIADCHKVTTGKNFYNVYGRMRWDKPSPTITAQFYAFGHGRYGHPEQDRALSLREGALLQSFPPDYVFTQAGEEAILTRTGRQIGNAVPVVLARSIALEVKKHIEESK